MTYQDIINIVISNDHERIVNEGLIGHAVEIQQRINTYHAVGDMLAKACRKASILSFEYYTTIVQCFPSIFHELLFENYERDCYAEEFTHDWDAARWERTMEEMLKLDIFLL